MDIFKPTILPKGARVIEYPLRHPVGGAQGALIELDSGRRVWMDAYGSMRNLSVLRAVRTTASSVPGEYGTS